MDAGCRPLQSPSPEFFRPRKTKGQKCVGSSINFTSVLGDLLISRFRWPLINWTRRVRRFWVTLIIIFVAARPGSFQFIQNQSVDTDEPASFRRWRPSFPKFHRIFSSLFLAWLVSFYRLQKTVYITTNNEYSRFYWLDNQNVYTYTSMQFVGKADTILHF